MKIQRAFMVVMVVGLLLHWSAYAQKKDIDGRSFVSNTRLSVVLKSQENKISLGEPVVIALTITNTESSLVAWEVQTHHPAETIFRYKLYLKGVPVKTTALFRRLWNEQEENDHAEIENQDTILFHLEPSESVTYKVTLGKLFEITEPGIYTLEAERTASDGKNIIRPQPFTFTIFSK